MATVDPVQTALDAFGALGQYAQTDPELKVKFDQAVANQWDAARFQREISQTQWWKTASDNAKNMLVLSSTDPAEYNNQLQNVVDSVNMLSAQLGLNPAKFDARTFATQALNGGWSTNTGLLTAHLMDFAGTTGLNRDPNTGFTSGVVGDASNHIYTMAGAYGIPLPQQQLDSWSQDIASGRQTTGGIDNIIIGWASSMYPQFAQNFKEGQKLTDIASPYMQAMQQTLELNGNSLSLTDPMIQKALQGDGKTPMTMYQFNQVLKSDPRWGQTDGAKNAAYDTLAKIGKDWGFM